jgi:hypothetical protein
MQNEADFDVVVAYRKKPKLSHRPKPMTTPPRRVIAICASSKPLRITREEDKLLYSSYDVKKLPQGIVVALALVGMPVENNAQTPESKWAHNGLYGKWGHPILDIIRVKGSVKHKGNLQLTPLSASAQAHISDEPELQAKLAEWGALNATIKGLSVRQPAAEAIASGEKNVENRHQRLFTEGDPNM